MLKFGNLALVLMDTAFWQKSFASEVQSTVPAYDLVSIVIIAHNYGQILEVCDRINLLQHGSITFDKPTSETSVQELTDLVVAEYRAARTQKLRTDPGVNARPTPRR